MAEKYSFLAALFSGATAGLVVDVSLYPLDTIKTRLQSEHGLIKAGGFKGIYRGIGPILVGSAPQAALFFCSYETIKETFECKVPSHYHPLIHMSAASISEVVACIVRVPLEIVKQRRQTSTESALNIFRKAYRTEGLRGLYRGYGSTVIRDIPFVLLQFPILEYFKVIYKSNLKSQRDLYFWEVASCGSVAGAIAAAVTTPLDVIKTRIMLADKTKVSNSSITMRSVARIIYSTQGMKGLFAGFLPRVLWISLGGYIFFGMYDLSKTNYRSYMLQFNINNY